ncbi:MAG: RsmE family RNA methyltransferase [Verrucomicrobia bacterium]|nr:RsmE family RNA methyltransferase [Verrucomicrobiota bacterium]MDA1065607.1 RsmE family RNA methyltransferase [Verrucomicrobiota bacterium]
MSDFRSYAKNLDSEENRIKLSPFESHHLVNTNRARKGDLVVVFNGMGIEWNCTLDEADKRCASLQKLTIKQYPHNLVCITLAIGIVKGKTFDIILRQATELGVTRIQPLLTERTIVNLKDVSSKCEKWQSHLIEGCKQSGNPWLPELATPVALKTFIAHHPLESAVVASLESTARPWSEINPLKSTTLFIGPEGDFSEDEYREFESRGVVPVSLGPHVLRSETAAVTAIAQLMAKF